MKNIRNDYCIRMFVGNDSFRPELMNVSRIDDTIYATNSSILASIKSELCVQSYNEVKEFPKCGHLIKEHISVEEKTLSVDSLFHELMKIECRFKPKMERCKECGGDGELVCGHCDSTYDCKECGGDGVVPGKELEMSGEYDCTLFNRTYKLQYLELIIRTAVFTGVNEIKISNSKGLKGTLFNVGAFAILLMPLKNYDF